MYTSHAAGASPDSIRRIRRLAPAVAALSLAVLCTAAARGAWAGKVQEFGPPVKAQGCSRCSVQAVFAEKIRGLDASMEFVELKDGVGVLYTVADSRDIPRVQKAAEWARRELQAIADDPEHYQLCSYCRATMAVFSQVHREIVRTGQGALFLMRSNDPGAVKALHDLMEKAQRQEANGPAPSR